MFNALKYIKNLEATGVPRNQAEAHVQLVLDAIEGEVATKKNFSDFRGEIRKDMADFRAEMKAEIADFRAEINGKMSDFRAETRRDIAELRTDMVRLENRLLVKLGGLLLACMTLQTGIIGALITFRGS